MIMDLNMFECIALGAGLNFMLFSGPSFCLIGGWTHENEQ